MESDGLLSLQGLNAAIKRFHDSMNETKAKVHEVTCRWSELRRSAMEAQRAVRGYFSVTVSKDAAAGTGSPAGSGGTAADDEAVQRVRREAQRQAEAKAQQEAAVELERKARRERDKKVRCQRRALAGTGCFGWTRCSLAHDRLGG